MPEKTEQELRAAFYYNVICTGGTKRLVATAEMKNDSQKGSETPDMNIFVPEIDSEYDLVLSLCEDGTQRITVDWDRHSSDPHQVVADYHSMVYHMGSDYTVSIVTPSSSNWHLWGNKPVTWPQVVTALQMVDNDGYLQMNAPKGFCALRPPWKLKNNLPWDPYHRWCPQGTTTGTYAGFDWSQAKRAEQEKPQGQSWDDLGWDDE